MKQALALVAMVALAGSAIATEEGAIQLKVYVDGMTCPTGCAPKATKNLQSVAGVKEVKLADFDAGAFAVSFDPAKQVGVNAFNKALDGFKIKKIEATISGTVAIKDKATILTTASGQTYQLAVGKPGDTCGDDAAKKETPTEESPLLKALRAKVDGLAKEGKQVKVSGTVAECCNVEIVVATIDEIAKGAN
jgi:copper chaperone CopZ